VSAPVRDATGEVVACVTLIVPSSALRARLQRLVNRSVRIADEVSLMLGWRAPLDEMRLAAAGPDTAYSAR
jgi:DNA-binding IclR family transcriptional regulator